MQHQESGRGLVHPSIRALGGARHKARVLHADALLPRRDHGDDPCQPRPTRSARAGWQVNTRTHIPDQVAEVIRRHLNVTDRDLDMRTHLADDLGADSLALVELTLVFEETFDIDITDEEADQIRTVRDAIISVERCLRTQRGG
jgi:acyl carrier protein